MSDKEQPSYIPHRHQEIINSLLAGDEQETLVRVPEGSYVQVDNEAYAGNFITCPAILIESPNTPIKCLHVTYDELMKAIEKQSFKSPINFDTVRADLSAASNIKVLLSSSQSTGESRLEELSRLTDSIHKVVGNRNLRIESQSVPGNQFQLVITPDAVSIWNGTQNLGLV